MAGASSVKKDRDPIMMICLVVFAVAAIAVIGIFIVNTYLPSGDEQASMGDEVTVDYTGTYYQAYGEEYAVVFDTNVASIGNDSNVKKANDYTAKTTYSGLTFTIGDGDMLAGFEKGIIGYKVGETIRIVIPAEEAYVAADTSGVLSTTGNTMASTKIVEKSIFTGIYSDVTLKEGQNVQFTTKMGWEANAMLVNNGKSVQISYLAEAGETYNAYESGDTVVNFKVTSVDGNTITYDIDVQDAVHIGNSTEIQMIKIYLGEEAIYITGVGGGEIAYKTGAEKTNQTLYFEVKITKIN